MVKTEPTAFQRGLTVYNYNKRNLAANATPTVCNPKNHKIG